MVVLATATPSTRKTLSLQTSFGATQATKCISAAVVLTIVRDAAYWRTYAAWRVGNWIADEGLVIFGAFREDADPHLCGFAFAEFYPPAFQVRDASVLPEEPGAMLALLTEVAAEARRHGIPPAGRMYLPRSPQSTLRWSSCSVRRFTPGRTRDI